MRKIFNPSLGVYEFIYSKEEKEILDIALHNLAVVTGNSSLAPAGDVMYE